VWTNGGFTLVYKKLERARFSWPSGDGDRARMTPAELAALLEGIDLANTRLRRWNPDNSLVDGAGRG
jgi:transposase